MTRLWNPHEDYPLRECIECGWDAYLIDGIWTCDCCGYEAVPERYEPEEYDG